MTIEDALGPLLLPVAIAVAIVAVVALCWHVARRYPSAPKRVPSGLRVDGRPRRLVSRRWLWAAPCILVAVTALVTSLAALHPPPPESVMTIALAFVAIAEVAGLTAWTIDRQIEFGRKMTYRIAPARLLRVSAPLLLTIAVAVFLALRPT